MITSFILDLIKSLLQEIYYKNKKINYFYSLPRFIKFHLLNVLIERK